MNKRLKRILSMVVAIVIVFSVLKVFAIDYDVLDCTFFAMPSITISETDRPSSWYFDGVIEIPLFENLLVARTDFDFGGMDVLMHLDDDDLIPHFLFKIHPNGDMEYYPFFFDEIERTIKFSVSRLTEFTFMPIYIREPNFPFEDVQWNAWYFVPVVWVFENEIMNGISPTEFAPNATMTRAMLVTVLWRYAGRPEAGEPTFNDVASGRWYSEAIAWAAENGIVTGFNETTFGVNEPVTREQMYTIFYRYMNFAKLAVIIDDDRRGRQFADEDKISDWAADAMHFMDYVGVMCWFDTSLNDNYVRPWENALRKEIARAMFLLDRLVVPASSGLIFC